LYVVYTVQNNLCRKKIRGKSDRLTHTMDEVMPGRDENERDSSVSYYGLMNGK
jgi:hypothetical protein